MKKIIIVSALALALGGCTVGFNPFASVKNVSVTNLYEAELAFDGSIKTFNELKGLCARRALPPVCRTYVKQGQTVIKNAYAADVAARSFIKNNPTLDATNVVQAFTGLVSNFQGTVASLSASK